MEAVKTVGRIGWGVWSMATLGHPVAGLVIVGCVVVLVKSYLGILGAVA